jgi:hypothetical protein
MKTHVVALLLACLATAASAQTFYIDWNQPNPITGPPTKTTMKRDGYVRNSTVSTKELYFRFNLDEVNTYHTAQLCMSLCWLLYRGEDYPFEREGQILTAGASLPIYVDLTPNGTEATSTIRVTLFDKTDTTDKLDFEVKFVVDKNTSVSRIEDVGVTIGPNPTAEVLSLTGEALSSVTSVSLYDMQGNIIRSYGVPMGSNVRYTLDGLASGTYRLVLAMRDGSLRGSAVTVAR